MMTENKTEKTGNTDNRLPEAQTGKQKKPAAKQAPKETGGPKGPEPTRYGDWEKAGRCTDF